MQKPSEWKFCPVCSAPLEAFDDDGVGRQRCRVQCGFVRWGNPTPVVAAIVQVGDDIVLVRNHGWPEKMFGLVSGFLEADEHPDVGVAREVDEELGLRVVSTSFIGNYAFAAANQLLIAYHVVCEGHPVLAGEIAAIKVVPRDRLRAWPFGTGQAVRDWLKANSEKRVD